MAAKKTSSPKPPKGFEGSKWDKDPKGTKEGSKTDNARDIAEGMAYRKAMGKKKGK